MDENEFDKVVFSVSSFLEERAMITTQDNYIKIDFVDEMTLEEFYKITRNVEELVPQSINIHFVATITNFSIVLEGKKK